MSHPTHNTALPGMGALAHNKGVAFRVWAPHADRVYVAGTFNDWSETLHQLQSENNGFWYGNVEAASIGDEYRYLLFNGKQKLWRIDPYARSVTHSAGNGIICERRKADRRTFTIPPLNELVIYEMHVGTFNRQPGDTTGEFEDVVARLDHLKDLGVNAVEVMPPTEFAGSASWGYNPAYIFAIESAYGGPAAFRDFVHAAHDHGIAVILDVVYNHLGPSDLGLWRFDGWSENDKGGIYFYNDHRAKTPWGDTRPDYGRPEVRQYLRDNALMWFEEFGVDGLRWDATAYIRNVEGRDHDPDLDVPEGWTLMQWINDEIHTRFPGSISVAEDLKNNAALTNDAPSGGGFDSQWSAAFAATVRNAVVPSDDDHRDMQTVADMLRQTSHEDAFERVVYTESHDEVANGKQRLPEEIAPGHADSWESKKRTLAASALLFATPGIPMIFQGQELLEDRWFHVEDPVDWTRRTTFKGILQAYRDLIRLRRNLDGMSRGLAGQNIDVYHLNRDHNVMAFQRWDRGGPRDTVVIIVNLGNETLEHYDIGVPRAGTWYVRFNGDWQGYDRGFGDTGIERTDTRNETRDGMPCSASMSIGPYSVLILSQDE